MRRRKYKEKKDWCLPDIVLPIKEYRDEDEDANEGQAHAAKKRWRRGLVRADSAPGGPSDLGPSDSAPSDSVNVANDEPGMDLSPSGSVKVANEDPWVAILMS